MNKCSFIQFICKRGLLALLVLNFYLSHAQEHEFSIVGLETGLSQSSVMSITQDRWGILWLGTQDGLNRYDGYEIQTFKNEPFDSTSLSFNNVSSLLADQDGNLWVGTTYGGLNLYDPVSQQFIRFGEWHGLNSYTITCLLQDRENRILVGTSNGLYRMEVKGENPFNGLVRFSEVFAEPKEKTPYSKLYIQTLHEDHDGTIWIGTQRGLFHLDVNLEAKSFEDLPTFNEVKQKPRIWAVTKDRMGRLILSMNEGCFIQDGNENKSEWRKFTNYPVSELLVSSHGDVLLGTEGNGLWVNTFDVETQTYADELIRWHDPRPGKPQLGRNMITSILEDQFQQGNFWVGTFTSGMIGIHPRTKQFHTDHLIDTGLEEVSNGFVTGLEKDKKGNVWIIVEGGLLFFDAKTRRYEFYPNKGNRKNPFWGKAYYSLKSDTCGNVWLGTNEGLNQIIARPGGHEVKSIPLPEACEKKFISCIRPGPDGKLYVGMLGGFNVFDPKTKQFQGCAVELQAKSDYSKGFRVNDLQFDRKGRLWISSSTGLFILNLKNEDGKILPEKVQHYTHDPKDKFSLRTSTLMTLAEDHTGRMWISSMNGLMWAEEKDDGWKFNALTEQDGLSNNTVYAVVADTMHRSLWMSTNRGLCRLNLEDMRFEHFDQKDGLQGTEFNQGAYQFCSDGEMMFGGLNGYTRFYPSEILVDTIPPQIWINKLIPEDKQAIDLLQGNSDNIELDYAHNSLQLFFVGINYLHTEKTQYAYRLITEGRKPGKWINNGRYRQAYLSNLSPGNYTFEVKAANADGTWNETPDFVHFRIFPPFWQTPPFFIGLLLLIAGILWGLHALRVQVKVQRVQELERVRKNTAADFHDELGHKLTIISLFGEILKQQLKGADGLIVPNLNKIIDTSNSLYYSMKDLLWVLDPEKDSVLDLVILLKDFGDELFDKTGVAFRTEGIETEMANVILPMNCKRHIALIFKEVMNNSLKHANGKNAVLSANFNQNHLVLSFSDDGKGFDVEAARGGHGISNLHDRAKKIRGELRIDSDENGTTVELICSPEEKIR